MEKITHLGPKLTEYLNNANDHAFGFRPVGKYKYIGDTKVDFDNNNIIVEGKKYEGTDGLLGLLTNKSLSDIEYTDEDLENYKEIAIKTHLIFKDYDPNTNQVRSNVGEKWNKIFKGLWAEQKKHRTKSVTSPKTGMGIIKKYNEKPVEYVWMNDVQELIDRLLVIHGEEKAGNDNFFNEKVSIIKMLTGKFQDFITHNPKGIPYLIRFLHNIPHTFWKSEKHGAGILNWAINHLPFELHLPGYNYCGPGTNLKDRLERGDKGINPLDEACKYHDIAYRDHKDIESRHQADKILQNEAKKRIFSKDADLKERMYATAVTGTMFAKRKLGMGIEPNWGI